MRRPTYIVAGYLALHLTSVHWDPLGLWGVDMLAYHPLWVQVCFAATGALLLVPRVRRGLLATLPSVPDGLNPWHSGASFIRASVALVCLALVGFIGLRSATHILGDRLLFVSELGTGTWEHVPRVDRAPVAFALVHHLNDLGTPIWGSGVNTYRLLSLVSGILYMLLALQTARALGSRSTEKTLILGFLVTTGSLQLFFGYVENYPLLHAGILLYLLLSLYALRGRVPIYVPASLLGILVSFHFTAAALAPSLLVLAGLQSRSRSDNPAASIWIRSARVSLHLLAFPILTLVIFALVGYHPLQHLGELGGFHVLPFVADPAETYHHGLVSGTHLLDMLNQMFLVAPAAIMVVCLRPRPARARNPYRTFLLAASAFPILFTWLANPSIGAFRDWDVFTFSALPFTLWAAVALIDRIPDRHRLAQVGLLFCGAALLHTATWVGVNANETSAETRFATLLDRCRLSVHARSYGWETLGIHYLTRAKTGDAQQAYELALLAAPENPRHWTSVGSFHFGSGHYEAAFTHYRKAIALRPDHTKAHASLGRTYHETGDYAAAVRHYRRSISLTPGDARLRNDLGNTFYTLGNHSSAAECYHNAVRLRPGFADAHSNLAAAAFQLRQYFRSVEHALRAVDLQPDLIDAHLNLGAAYRELGQMAQARSSFERVLQLNPNDPQAPTIRQWLSETP